MVEKLKNEFYQNEWKGNMRLNLSNRMVIFLNQKKYLEKELTQNEFMH